MLYFFKKIYLYLIYNIKLVFYEMPKGRTNNLDGRPKGALNVISRTAKNNIADVFDHLGGILAMVEWARENQTEFYKIYSRLLPIDISAKVENKILKVEVKIDGRSERGYIDNQPAPEAGNGSYIAGD